MQTRQANPSDQAAQQQSASPQAAQRSDGRHGVVDDARFEATAQRQTRDMLAASPQAQHMQSLQAMLRPAARGVAQRVADNRDRFQQFLQQKVPGRNPDLDLDYGKAMACAIVLDTHHAKAAKLVDPRVVKTGIPLGLAPDAYHKRLSQYIEGVSGTQLNVVTWGAPRNAGDYVLGSSVDVVFHSGHAQGSATQKAVPWMEQLKQRRDGSGTLYVMGHLLNADLGGPSLDYNYVPLTGRAGFYGANGANGVHSDLIEQIVKTKVLQVGRGVTAVHYSVAADYARAPRAGQIGQLEAAVVKMGEIEKALPAISKGSLMTKSKDVKEKLRKAIDGNLGAALNAVSSNNYWRSSWATNKNRIKENIALWRLEDAIVPNSLRLHLSWTQDGVQQALDYDTPVFLPTALDTPYAGKLKSGGKGEDPVKHDTQFQDFLLKNLNPQEIVGSKVGAFLMDRQQYEIDQIADLMQNYDQLPALALKRDDSKTTPQQKERLEEQIEAVETNAAALASDIFGLRDILRSDPLRAKLSQALAGKGENEALDMAPVSGMFYGGLKALGGGTTKMSIEGKTPIGSPAQVTVTYAPNGHPEGSSAGGDNTWMSRLEQRRMPDDGSATVYVRGHMINRHIGGAGLDTNMVPLTGRGGWYGANDANAIHSGGIEETVKKLYKKLETPTSTKPGAVTSLVYSVRAIFGDHARPQTPKVGQACQEFRALEETVKSGHLQEFNQKGPEEVGNLFLGYLAKDFSEALNSNPTQASQQLVKLLYERYAGARQYPQGDPLQEPLLARIVSDFGLKVEAANLRNAYIQHIILPQMSMASLEEAQPMIAARNFNERWRMPLSTSPAVIEAIGKKPLLEPIMKASTGREDYAEESLHEIGARMQGNWQLWQAEDVLVPLGLDTMARWTQDGTVQERRVQIPNVLPSDVRAPYDPRENL